MKKENKVVKFAIIVLALTMIALILVSGTYAKYTSEAEITGSVKVASWKITVSDKDGADIDITDPEVKTVDVALINTIYDAESKANGTVATDAETDVDESGATKLIAPGTSGKFDFTIKNLSQVTATYTVTFEDPNTTVPLEYSADGTTWSKDISVLNVSTNNTLAMNNGSKKLDFYWRWAFEGEKSATHTSDQTDSKDTDLGRTAQTNPAEVTLRAKIVATQVN